MQELRKAVPIKVRRRENGARHRIRPRQKVNGPQRLWPISLGAVLRHFVLPFSIPSTDCAVEAPEDHLKESL